MQARRSHVVTLIAGIAIGMLVFGTAEAVTSTSFTYSKAKIGYYALSPHDFSPNRLDGATNDYMNDITFLENTDTLRYFVAGVHLPNGAKVLSITFWYQSSSLAQDFIGELDRSKLATSTFDDLGRVFPHDDSGVRTGATAVVDPTMQAVNNSVYNYSAYVGVYASQDFYGARIKYSYTSAGA